MKTQDEVRDFILQKSQEVPDAKGALATWSRAIGRNEAYLHQFIHKRSPRKLHEEDRAKLAEVMQVPETELMVGSPASPTNVKFIRSKTFRFYVAEWREFMGVSLQSASKAAGMPDDEYGAFEFYPVNFTLAQIVALADEFGIRGDQFWFPPPKKQIGSMPKQEIKKTKRQ